MTAIANDHVVEIEYTLSTIEGEFLDSTDGREPLSYIHGKQNIMPNLEKQLTGKSVNDVLKVTLPPDLAYGEIDKTLIQAIDKKQFGEDADNIELGMQFKMEGEKGNIFIATAIEIRENDIVVDGNHPFSGETLVFDVKIKSIRNATTEELAKGDLIEESSCCGNSNCCG